MAITVNIYYKGTGSAAKQFAREMTESGTVGAIRKETGNLRYEYFSPLDDEETVLLIDSWENQEAIDMHHASPMMNTIMKLRENTDFIGCVAFGRNAEFAEKYLRQGTKIVLTGRIQTGSYTNRDGQKVYTTDIVVEEQEFAESKAAGNGGQNNYSRPSAATSDADGFMNIPDGIDDELPFS